MSYRVQFVGLICFYKENGSRLALLPDGRMATPQHHSRIAVDPGSIVNFSPNWPTQAAMQGDFLLSEPSVIQLETADQVDRNKPLDTSNHNPISLGAGFQIKPATAGTIAQVGVRQGVLQTYRYPGTDDTPDASIISQLDVDHVGRVHVIVTTGTAVKTIELNPGTEIAIVNDSPDKQHDHFHIYEQLSSNGSTLGLTPGIQVGKYLESPSRHRVFTNPNPIVDGVKCPNTGCCP